MKSKQVAQATVDWPTLFASLSAASAEQARVVADTRARLERARSLMHGRYAEPLDLERLARAAHFSRHHFVRSFRREFELTPHQYLTQRRVAAAKELLEGTELSVTEVCLAVGFSSLGSFSTLFRRHVGHAPAHYRRLVVPSAGVPGPALFVPGCFMARHRPLSNFREASPQGLS
ncbi:putative transcriptional regulator [Plesiocystis pacifica SIR-1]|uniref:Putative transcriptional regulator n=1 Tax=Plesiocystis pacifica SIR-1 TaxID=391625 RepID=A6GDR8_9BACT|nr:AraC family transcriptional regulator [Plesiocystis pacifica]EDM75957.1 putative transcriptional regulator [Plesiocystis pacifica SIR-1]